MINNIDYDNLTIEELNYFKEKYIDMFLRIKELSKYMKREIEPDVDKSKINNIDVSLLGRIILAAKKFILNTAISYVTDIEPRFMENDLKGYFSREQRKRRYQNSNQLLIAYSALSELEIGINRTLEMLNTSDERKLKDVLKQFQAVYIEMKETDFVPFDDAPCYSPQIAYFMYKYLKTISVSAYDKVDALVDNNIDLGINVNLPKEIIETIDNFRKEDRKTR